MGGLDTALVAAPEGDLDDYLESLAVLRALEPRIIHPAHGPAFPDPAAALARYAAHRGERERQVLDALRAGPRAVDELAGAVYGHALPSELRRFTAATVEAYLYRLERRGAVRRSGSAWERVA
jgi:glyoxylase-like metal-dependent hydrolase (beta-lactamase superfamily II)